MGEIGRDDLEMRCRLEGLHDFIHRHRSKEQEEARGALGHFGTYLPDEVVVDAVAAEVSAQRPHCCTEGHTEERHEEHEPQQRSPKGAIKGTSNRPEMRELSRPRLFPAL